MATTTTDQWMRNVQLYIDNPIAIQRQSLAQIEARANGEYTVVDPSNPFVFLLEAIAVNTAAAMVKNEANTRKMYPTMALTDDEVYMHMSDADFVDRFASPAGATFRVLLNKDEIYNRAVTVPGTTTRKLTIPRNTEFTVAQVVFTMQYPIDIRIMAHNGLQIVYNTDIASPLQTLSSNVVDWGVVNINGVEYIRIDIPVNQFEITSYTTKLSSAGSVSKTYTLTDSFYYARAYYSDLNGNWIEMHTTHTDQVFDPTDPTILLKLSGNKLTMTLPAVYVTTGQVTTELRLDIYTTNGALKLSISNYATNSFVATWKDLSSTSLDVYSAPMAVFSDMAIYSPTDVDGGTAAMTFEELRTRVINNALGAPDLPITNAQLTTRLAARGYSMVMDIDQVTNRQFLATRLLPTPTDGSIVSGAGASIQTLVATMEDLVRFSECVSDNGNRITILPKALYSYSNGKISLVSQTEIDSLMALEVDSRARRINESQYLYSPFHYVLDINDDRFDLRAYYMDNPGIEAKSYIEENDTTGLSVTVASCTIQRIEGGYMLVVVCNSTDGWKALEDDQVYCQLAFTPTGEKDMAYQNGTMSGVTASAERVFTFFLGTNFDIDANDDLYLNTFQMYDNGARPHACSLLNNFDIFFGASGLSVSGMTTSSIDDAIGKQLLPEDIVGINRERISVRLGNALNGLWSSARSVVGEEDYQRYTVDVPWLYEEDIFERDPVTNAIKLTIDEATNKVTYYYLHRKNDPILDQNGNPTYRYRAGDIMMDPDGNPIVISSRKMERQSDIFMIDGVYWFATEANSMAYRDSIPDTIVGWLNNDIAPLDKVLLEKTDLYYYAQSTIGSVNAYVGEEKLVALDAAQSFEVVFYVNGTTFRDAELRASLSTMAIQVINDVLSNQQVAMADIISTIKTKAGSDIIGVTVDGLGGAADYGAITIFDDSARLSIRRIAKDMADGTLSVADDVSITFLQHTS